MIEIRPITARQTWPLRSRVLKPYLKPEECANPGDDDALTLHLGAFFESELQGIATFLPEAHPFFTESVQPYRLRGMASAPELHRRGMGRALVEQGQFDLRQRGCDLLWFNAREVAFPFYESLGFKYFGEMFDLPLIGPHKLMFKNF